jgi:hypothetical protein
MTVTTGATALSKVSEQASIVEVGEGIGTALSSSFFRSSYLRGWEHKSPIRMRTSIRQVQRKTLARRVRGGASMSSQICTLGFAQIQMSDHAEVSLEKLSTRRQTRVSSVRQAAEIGVLDRHAGGVGAGAGMSGIT